MRAVDKGVAPQVYTQYKDARPDLEGRLGKYCSYCEMRHNMSMEVEHVQPTANGGAELGWDNFLLACKQCNIHKSNHNTDRSGYLWPDQDNTILTFEYTDNPGGINPCPGLPLEIKQIVESSIELMQLRRHPASNPAATMADTRWLRRQGAWDKAKRSLGNWLKNPIPAMADQIGETAEGTGFYSIWLTVFADHPIVISAIKSNFPNTYEPAYDAAGNLIVRAGGRF